MFYNKAKIMGMWIWDLGIWVEEVRHVLFNTKRADTSPQQVGCPSTVWAGRGWQEERAGE